MLRLAEKIFTSLNKKGVSEAEFYGLWKENVVLEISDGRVKTISYRSIGEYGVRASIGRKVAGISSSDLEPNTDLLAERLVKIVKAAPENMDWRGFSKNYRRGIPANIYDKHLKDLEPSEMIERLSGYMDTSIKAALEKGADETRITQGMVSYGVAGIVVANTDGEHLADETTNLMIFYEVKSRKNGGESSFNTYYMGRRLDDERIIHEARRSGEYSVLFADAKPIPSGRYKLLLDPYMAALFIDTALVPAFSALNVQENRSPLKGKIDQQILHESITILDDPSIDWGVGSRSFDDEGIPTTRKPVVENGVLYTYLYDYYTACRENKTSTGNGFRRSPGSQPSPAPTNIVVEAEKTWTWDELIEEMDRGLIVHGMIGYWMSNPVNGATQATVSHGLYVENGEVRHPVKGVVIGGNIYDWLWKNMVAVGRELVSVGDIYSRPILVSDVGVAGK